MIILGIDPGTATTGYGVVKKDGSELKSVDFGCISTPAKIPLAERLEMIEKELSEVIEKYRPDQMAVEKIFFSSNSKTAIAVGHARGVILLTARKKRLEVFEYTPLEVKIALTGYGRADKNQIQQMVKSLLGLPETPKPDDAADALAVAVCRAHTRKNCLL